jgi:transcriptional regulator with XRE-family HTH domain
MIITHNNAMGHKVLYKKLGTKIRFYRKNKELTIEKLAELAKVSECYMGEMERGRKKPSVDTLSNIAKALDVDLYLLFKFD